jgi:hypothetical protein
MSSLIVQVNTNQLSNAIKKCMTIYNGLVNFLNTYRYSSLISVKANKYYFSVGRTDKDSKYQICVSPVTNEIEVYSIVNGQKCIDNLNINNKFNNHDDIIKLIDEKLMYEFKVNDMCSDLYTKMKDDFLDIPYTINKAYSIVNILDSRGNGYYIYFDNDLKMNIGTVIDNMYYDSDHIWVNNYQDLVNKINELINDKYVDNIKYYNIIDCKYLECDMSNIQDAGHNMINIFRPSQNLEYSNSECSNDDPC